MRIQAAGIHADDYVVLAARMLLATLFFVFGWSKIIDIGGAVTYMQQLAMPASRFAAYVAVLIELGAGVLVLVGLWTRPAACLLAVYTVAAGMIGHPFWMAEGEQRYVDTVNFYKNLGIAGGFLLLFILGAGRLSVDARRSSR